ncbi:MAG TPA: methyltransferase domain-containing protein [Patescibacteria group bacterium]
MRGVPKIPYFQTSRYRVATMVELAKPTPSDLVADLGVGDGRITLAFAKTGAETHGFEIDEDLKKLAEENIKKEGLNNAYVYGKDFWAEDLSQYTIICCYPMPTIMGHLENKLKAELKPGTKVLLNYFPFLHWKEKMIKDNIYLYVR